MNTVLKTIMIIAAAVMAVACEDGDPQGNAAGEARTVLTFKETQKDVINLYNVQDPSYTFTVLKEGPGACLATVAGMTQEQLNEYDPTYTALTPECYTLDAGELVFQEDETSREVSVSFSDENIANIRTLASASGGRPVAFALAIGSEDADTDPDASVVYREIIFTGDKPLVGFAGEKEDEIEMIDGKDLSVSFSVYRLGASSVCSARVVPVSQDELSAYNPEYVSVPSECYSFEENVTFSEGEMSKEVTVHFTADAASEIMTAAEEGKKPVLALALESDNADVDPDNGTVYRTVNIRFAMTAEMGNLVNIACDDDGDKDIIAAQIRMAEVDNLPQFTFSLPQGVQSGTTSVFTVKYRSDLAEKYNTDHHTFYDVLPEGDWVVPESAQMPEGENSFTLTLRLNPEMSVRDNGFGQYIFPLEISNDVFDIEGDNVFYVVLNDEVDLTADDLWSPCSVEELPGDGGRGIGLKGLLDNSVSGNDASFWSSTWFVEYRNENWHHFVQVNFEESLTRGLHLQYWGRDYTQPNPREIEIWATDQDNPDEYSNEGWTMLGRADESDGLPTAVGVGTWSSPAYDFSTYPELAGKEIKHLRFVVVRNEAGVLGQGGTQCTSFAELKIFGY